MRRQQKIREQKKWEGRCFLLIIAALSLLKLWLVQGLVIHPLPSAMCDDVLLRDWATSIAGGEWMGPFFPGLHGILLRIRLLHNAVRNRAMAAGTLP